MSVDQVQNFRFIRSLFKELRTFGLNPNQWRLSRAPLPLSTLQSRTFAIYHNEDRDFQLMGTWQKKMTGQLLVSDLRVQMESL